MRSLRDVVDRDAVGALVLTAAVPFLFIHERFQADYSLALGSATIDLRLSDAAILAVLTAAAVSVARRGIGRFSAARAVWLPGIALLAWLAFETLRPVSLDDPRFEDNVVSALKLGEYALLAPAVPLLIRRVKDLATLLVGLVLWSSVATAVAVVQFFGLDIFAASSAGWRYPSFLGRHDLAAISAIATCLAAAAVFVGRRWVSGRGLFTLALAAGVLGLILAGSVTAAAGLAIGVSALALVGRSRYSPSGRKLLALAAIVAVVAGGVTAIRSEALDDFLQFVGIREDRETPGVESYSQRTVLAYIGLRIFEDSPILGVGWQRSSRPDVFEPYLDDARRRFPDVNPLAFPAAGREWGVQNLYIQMLADSGVVGLLLLLAVGVGGLVLARRTAAHASNPWAAGAGLTVVCALLTLAGVWASLGIVPGIPLQAATCLLLGLAAAGAATVEEETGG
ncbi:MAG: O-antigen ligase family protein [Gaiellaceae bacterium]